MLATLNQPDHALPYAVRMSSRIQEASDHMRLLQGWQLRYEQLSRGRFQGSLREAWINGIHLYQESLSQIVFQTGLSCDQSVCLGVFSSLSGEAKWFGEELTIDDVMFLNGGDELVLRTPKESTLLVISIPKALIGDVECTRTKRYLRHPALAQRLRQAISQALDCLLCHPLHFATAGARARFTADMQGLMAEYFSNSAGGTQESPRDRAKVVVDQAMRFVDECRSELPSIADICRKTFISRRTLQNCFEKIAGESPACFLKAQRLNAVRRTLLEGCGEARIGDVAAEWGFWHFSQFSSDYKRLFGENPSETVAFARSRRNL